MYKQYWINTSGAIRLLINTTDEELIDGLLIMMYEMKKTNAFVYYLYSYGYINLVAEDKFFWLKAKLKSVLGWQ